MSKNSNTFLEIIGTLRGLARCGSAIRGHSDDDGNLMRLLEERAVTNVDIKAWLKKSVNFLSHDCQNELLSIMSAAVQRKLVTTAKHSPFFAIIADGTTDIAKKEQFSICIRYTDEDMAPREEFLGLYECPDATSETLAKAVIDVTQRLMGEQTTSERNATMAPVT